MNKLKHYWRLVWLLIGILWVMAGRLMGASAENTVVVPDDGWRLWPDTNAAWKDDALYLPDDVDIAKLPVNAPTGGWGILSGKTGMGVTLPSTVEEHYWGVFGLRPYTRYEYSYAGRDPDVKNGNYEGVSWWWRDVKVPAGWNGKLVLLHVRGARQRAEVYVNQQLVGYDMIAETAFECDITKALRAGKVNQIAIRITNPGGWMDWQDYNTITWGRYTFQRSHGFGGLDRGMTITAESPMYLADSWVLNTPEVRTITVHATVTNTLNQARTGAVEFRVIDPKAFGAVASQQVEVDVPANSSRDVECSISCDKAELWDVDTPRLYLLRTDLEVPDMAKGRPISDQVVKPFGFRWFEPRGVGSTAGLYLNGKRVRLYTAISWGYWGFNGLWPTPALAEKEVRDAKALNLNMLNFHRDIGKEEVLEKQDEMGLLRYMEPGGAKVYLGKELPVGTPSQSGPIDTSGKGGEPRTFGERYMAEKVERMVKQFRSHPSLVIDMMVNETEADLTNPHVFYLLRRMHELDPSRVIATKSGISPAHQAWFAPYATEPMVDDGTGYSGWYDHHTVGGPGVWQDGMYQGPDNFTHRIDDRKEIVDWGEMLGAAVADNHPMMVSQIKKAGGTSYDLKDHEEVAAAYHEFLDKWGFRGAFPTDESFFRELGNKCYEFWGRVIETARLSESNDILSISGWESTAIENHSGLVDNLRNFKGDPVLISSKLARLLPVVKARASILRVGGTGTLDVYLLNETGKPVAGALKVTMADPTGKVTTLGSYPAPAFVADQFVYPVKMEVNAGALGEGGTYKVSVTFGKVTNSTSLLVVETKRPELAAARVGVAGENADKVLRQLRAFPQVKAEKYQDGVSYDLIIAAPRGNGRVVRFDDGVPIKNTEDAALYHESIRGKANQVRFHFDGIAPGLVKVSLYFCEQEAQVAGKRRFDIAINGQTVEKDLEIFAEAGGQNIPLIKTYNVDAPQGTVDISTPASSKTDSLFNAIKIEAGSKVIAITCGREAYTDKSGLVWQPYKMPEPMPDGVLERVKAGTPLLILTSEEGSGDAVGRELAAAGAIQYAGTVPTSRASWMGGWVFVKKHPLYAGMPVNEVMKGDYQAPVDACYGLLVDGPGVDIVAAYSRDHDRNIGAMTFTARLGKGMIVYQGLMGMHPILQERWLGNALDFLMARATPQSTRP
jgi:hypothetical protein